MGETSLHVTHVICPVAVLAFTVWGANGMGVANHASGGRHITTFVTDLRKNHTHWRICVT